MTGTGTGTGAGEPPRTRIAARQLARARARQRIRLSVVAGLLLSAVVLAGAAVLRDTGVGQEPAPDRAAGEHAASPAPEITYGPGPEAPDVDADWPEAGPGTWQYAAGGEVLGAGGDVVHIQVAVEDGLPVLGEELAAEVDAILGDPRGWSAAAEHRFQRVGQDEEADFEILLVTPGTAEELCTAGGFHTGPTGSCRLPGQMVVNVAGWLAGAPGYGAPLAEYRAYVINHGVGRELGYGPEACAAPGQPAPVMLPLNLDPRGCTPNGWPYLAGERHTGPAVP